MKKTILLYVAVFLTLLIALLFILSHTVAATADKIYWCHVEPNGNQQTLHLPLQAITNAGHADAQGNPLHAGDHAGACVEPTPSPSPIPTDTPRPTPISECEDCDISTPTPTPEPTATPSAEVKVSNPQPLTPDNESDSGCGDIKPGDVAGLFVDSGVIGDGKLEVRWWPPSGASKVHIRYTDANPGDWRYALLNTDNDGHEEIGELKSNVHYFFQVIGVNGCATGNPSAVFDPIP